MERILRQKYIELHWQYIKNNISEEWNWMWLNSNPYLMPDDIIPLDAFYDYNSYKFYETLNPLLIFESKNNWDWNLISNNKNITITDIKKNIDKPWNWYNLSKNMKWIDIKNNFDLPWNWNGISENINLSIEILKNNQDKNWNYQNLSNNTMENGIERYIQRELRVICYLHLKNTKLINDIKLYICAFL